MWGASVIRGQGFQRAAAPERATADKPGSLDLAVAARP